MTNDELIAILDHHPWTYLLRDSITQTRIGYCIDTAVEIPELDALTAADFSGGNSPAVYRTLRNGVTHYDIIVRSTWISGCGQR